MNERRIMTTKVVKPSGSKKGGTESGRNFSYKSFTKKIANLKIDPVRRVRNYVDDEETTESFFKNAYDKWIELNLSTPFSQFCREVGQLCESLPLILHHKDRIFELLHTYIAQRDALSLEPLLDMLSQFAHDLGATFEPYLARSVILLSSLVAKHVDVEVIEWTFNCLAYLLKYLSKLLVPDLRPLYDILAPLLGREHQKTFVVRFAAEALSFLIRKAKGESLRLIVQHVFEDLQANQGKNDNSAYSHGLMTMFKEACVGVDQTIHSRGPAVFGTMLEVAAQQPDSENACMNVLIGVLIGLIHHTRPPTFQPIYQTIQEFIKTQLSKDPTARTVEITSKLLYTCVSVRKGDRIQQWNIVGEQLQGIVEAMEKLPVNEDVALTAVWPTLKAVAVVVSYADVDVVISKCSRLVEKARDVQGSSKFLPFCEFASSLEQDRFTTFILPYLHRFMSSQWASHEASLCLLVPKLASAGVLRPSKENDSFPDLLSAKSSLTAGALKTFGSLASALVGEKIEGEDYVLAWRYLDVLSSVISSNGSASVEIFEESLISLMMAISNRTSESQLAALAGKVLKLVKASDRIPSAQLVTVISAFGQNPSFLEGAFEYVKRVGAQSFNADEIITLSDSLISRLSSPSGDVRRFSLYILELLAKAKGDPTDIIRTAATVEEIPLAISNQRNISMYVRKLGMEYPKLSKDSWGYRIVPSYCFGLMTARFAPLWEDASKALASVIETNEETVAELAFKWLSGEGLEEIEHEAPDAEVAKPQLTPFECSNVRSLELTAEKCVTDAFSAKTELEVEFSKDAKIPSISISTARDQALYVLCEIPQIAEKRSRILVPMFLEWSRMDGDLGDDDEEDAPQAPVALKWSRRNQTAMLTLFTKFHNPRVLFKAELVYESLLKLIASGDAKVQSLSLKAILTWKIPGIKAYEDQLTNLLDDTRFRDELTNFVQVGEDDSAIQGQHRDALMPVLFRLLYGRSLSRKRASSGKKGMSSTRTAILASLSNFQQTERGLFVDITLGELAGLNFVDKTMDAEYKLNMSALGSVHFSLRKQLGLVRMFEDLLKQLGTTLLPHMPKMLDALLYCLVSAAEGLKTQVTVSNEEEAIAVKSLKAIRQGGLKVLTSMFHYCPTFGWKPYLRFIFDILINPRLEKLPIETSQSVSSILQLFSTWAASKHTVLYLTEYNSQLLPTIAECLGNATVKDEVVLFIVQFVRKIVQHADHVEELETASLVKDLLLRPNVDLFLNQLGSILRKSLGKDVLEQCIETVAALAPHVSGNKETTQLVEISIFLLDQPSRRVNPKTKSEILKILVNFLPLCIMEKGDELFEQTFKSVSSLFGFFKDRVSRKLLAQVLQVFADRDEEIKEVAELSRKLNSFSAKRLDEPDFEQRLEAYAAINETRYSEFNSKQWLPLVYNMLFFIQDNEELAIRTNASYALKRYAEVCGSKIGTDDATPFISTLNEIILPAIRAGAREQSELVRLEYITVMAHVVKECPTLEGVGDMQPLLVGGDEEANFFANILHIQQHRRSRALRRLAELVKKHHISSSNIAHFLLPLIEHFVFDQAEGEHNLANDTVITIGALAEQLDWQQYRAITRRFTGYIKSKPELEKIVVRLIGTAVNALANAWDIKKKTLDGDGDVNMEEKPVEPVEPIVGRCHLADSMPEQQKLANDITNQLLPTLSNYLHQKDESTVALRVPIAVSIVKLLRVMPEDMLKAKLPAVLTDTCHILRSRAQDSRDMTRKTLAEIAMLLGPEYFSFILKELRGALLRGYQLHVLSYTVHSILVAIVPKFPSGSLDYCVGTIVDIIMDDIFGVTGSEKDEEGYISKMKEVKGSMSYDSMDILASITTLPYLGRLIRPIKTLLLETLTMKLVKKIDELLRRITIGLLKNEVVKDRNLLVFCYEIVQEVYKTQSTPEKVETVDEHKKRYIVNLKVPSKSGNNATTTSNVSKLIRFALDILRTILGKHQHLMTPENMAGFVPVIGDSILSKHEEVQVSALRLLTSIIKVDLTEIDEGSTVFLSKAVSFIKSSPSTKSELAQASMKLIEAILRERQNVAIKESTIAFMLTRIKMDLEEPDRQGVAFNFIESVLIRKIVIPEVYEIIDQIAKIMVTNQTQSVRDKCRKLYFLFLMEYPQGQGRLKKQLKFLVENVTYAHESGRKSVLDAMHLVLTKFGENLIQEVIGIFFGPLALVIVNDESAVCREMAGTLLKVVFSRADKERQQVFLQPMRTWLEQDQQQLLTRLALQLYGLFVDVVETKAKPEVSLLNRRLRVLLQNAVAEDEDEQTEWEIVYFSLQLWSKLTKTFPETTLSSSSADMWTAVRGCLRFPHSWIRITSAKLLGLLFAEYSKESLEAVPLVNSRGLKLEGADMTQIALATSGQLNSPELTEELGLQVVRNLLFLARCFYANKLVSPKHTEEATTEEESEAKTALDWVVGRISGVIRSERNASKGIKAKNMGKKYALQFLAAMVQVVNAEDLAKMAVTLLMPLYNLIELPDASETKDLKELSQEIQQMIQTKVGTTEYAKAYNTVRQVVQDRRQERRNKRKIELVTNPERAAKRKERKHERKREVRKEKGQAQRDYRQGKI